MIISRTSMFHDWVVGKIVKSDDDGALLFYVICFSKSGLQGQALEDYLKTQDFIPGPTATIVAVRYKKGLRQSSTTLDTWLQSGVYSSAEDFFKVRYMVPYDRGQPVAWFSQTQYNLLKMGQAGYTAIGNRNAMATTVSGLQWRSEHPDMYLYVLNVQAPIYADYRRVWYGSIQDFQSAFPNNKPFSAIQDINRFISMNRHKIKISKELATKFTSQDAKQFKFGYNATEIINTMSHFAKLSIAEGGKEVTAGDFTASTAEGQFIAEATLDLHGCVNETWTATYNDGVFTMSGATVGPVGTFEVGEEFAPINPATIRFTGYTTDLPFFTLAVGAIGGTWTNGDTFGFRTVTTVAMVFGTIGTTDRANRLVYEYYEDEISGDEVLTGWYKYMSVLTDEEYTEADAAIRAEIEAGIAGTFSQGVEKTPSGYYHIQTVGTVDDYWMPPTPSVGNTGPVSEPWYPPNPYYPRMF